MLTDPPYADSFGASLTLLRPLASLDLETTGPFVGVDRVIDVGIAIMFPDGHVEEWSTLVNPGIPISPSSTAVHGITDNMVADAPHLEDIAPEITKRIAGCDITGYNVKRFDVPFLKADLERVGTQLDVSGAAVVDAMHIFHHFEKRDLAAAHLHYCGYSMKGAHRALADANGALLVLQEQVKIHSQDGFPVTPDGIVEALRDPNFVDDDGKLILRDELVCIGFGKHRGHSLRWVWKRDRSFFDWMMRGDFTDIVKQVLCAFAFDRVRSEVPRG